MIPHTLRPGDRVSISHPDHPEIPPLSRTIYSLHTPDHDLESPGIYTTSGDWYAYDDGWTITPEVKR